MNAIIVLLVHKEKNAKEKTHTCATNTTGAYLSYRTRTRKRREKENVSIVKDIFSSDMIEEKGARALVEDFSLKIVSSCQLECNLSKDFQ